MSLRHGVPKNPPLGVHPQTSSKVPYTLPSSVSSNSFICHSYANCRGVYPFFPFWHRQSQITNHESPFLPPLSFQSLTNCPRFATHSEPLSFQPITNCSICKSFVLIMIQQYPGWVGTSLLRPSRKTLSPLIPDPVSSSFVPRIRRRRVRGFFGSSSALNCELLAVGLWANSFRINTCEPLVTVDSKRLTQTLNPLDATLTKKPGVGGSPANLPTCKRASSDTCPEGVHPTYYWSRRTLPANSPQAKFLCFGTPRFGTWTPTRSGSSFPVGGCDGQVFS